MKKNINLLQEIVRCLSGLEFNSFKNTKEDFVNFINREREIITPEIEIDTKSLYFLKHIKPDNIYELRAPFGICHFAFYSSSNKTIYVLGPALTELFDKKKIEREIKELNLGEKTREHIIRYCSSLPVVSYATIHNLSAILAKELCGTTHFMSHETIEYMPTKQTQEIDTIKPPSELSKMRRIEEQYEMNNALVEAVKLGNVSLALSVLAKYSYKADFQVRNTNPLRNMQNYCIVLNTQLRRAIEETGLHPYSLDLISSEIGLKIETLKTVDEAREFIVHSIRRYCEFVRENNYQNLSSLVHLAVTFVKEHLTEDISVKKAAEVLSVNANYLSTVFKREMGLSFIDFVNRERINQAEALLTKTSLPISRIAITVGYNNTSYFAKQFIRFKGKTPTDYRKNK